MTKPPFVTELSVYHVMVWPGAIATFDGPVLPVKRVVPIWMRSKYVSVLKYVDDTVIAWSAVTVQLSELP